MIETEDPSVAISPNYNIFIRDFAIAEVNDSFVGFAEKWVFLSDELLFIRF